MFTALFSSSPRIFEQIVSDKFFLLFFVASLALFIFTFALSISGIDEQWKKRCALALVICVIPVLVGIVYLLRPRFSPYDLTLNLWLGTGFLYVSIRIILRVIHKTRIKRQNCWQCPRCKGINENVFLSCRHCRHPR